MNTTTTASITTTNPSSSSPSLTMPLSTTSINTLTSTAQKMLANSNPRRKFKDKGKSKTVSSSTTTSSTTTTTTTTTASNTTSTTNALNTTGSGKRIASHSTKQQQQQQQQQQHHIHFLTHVRTKTNDGSSNESSMNTLMTQEDDRTKGSSGIMSSIGRKVLGGLLGSSLLLGTSVSSSSESARESSDCEGVGEGEGGAVVGTGGVGTSEVGVEGEGGGAGAGAGVIEYSSEIVGGVYISRKMSMAGSTNRRPDKLGGGVGGDTMTTTTTTTTTTITSSTSPTDHGYGPFSVTVVATNCSPLSYDGLSSHDGELLRGNEKGQINQSHQRIALLDITRQRNSIGTSTSSRGTHFSLVTSPVKDHTTTTPSPHRVPTAPCDEVVISKSLSSDFLPQKTTNRKSGQLDFPTRPRLKKRSLSAYYPSSTKYLLSGTSPLHVSQQHQCSKSPIPLKTLIPSDIYYSNNQQQDDLTAAASGDDQMEMIKLVEDNFSSSITEEEKEEAAKISRMRKNVIKELVDTEKSYVEFLTLIQHYLIIPLQKDAESNKKPILPLEKQKKIFLNLPSLVTCHVDMLKQLSRSIANDNEMIADVFVDSKMNSFFQLYRYYVNNFDKAREELQSARTTHPALCKFILESEEKLASELGNALSIEAILIMPVQRIPRYLMLVNSLLNFTSLEHPDYDNLLRSRDQFQAVTTLINESKRNAEKLEELKKICGQIAGFPTEMLLSTDLSLIKSGELINGKSSDSSTPLTKLFVLLLSNCLVISTTLTSDKKVDYCCNSTRYKYKLIDLITLKDMRFYLNTSKEIPSLVIMASTGDIGNEEKKYKLRHESLQEIQNWNLALLEAYARVVTRGGRGGATGGETVDEDQLIQYQIKRQQIFDEYIQTEVQYVHHLQGLLPILNLEVSTFPTSESDVALVSPRKEKEQEKEREREKENKETELMGKEKENDKEKGKDKDKLNKDKNKDKENKEKVVKEKEKDKEKGKEKEKEKKDKEKERGRKEKDKIKDNIKGKGNKENEEEGLVLSEQDNERENNSNEYKETIENRESFVLIQYEDDKTKESPVTTAATVAVAAAATATAAATSVAVAAAATVAAAAAAITKKPRISKVPPLTLRNESESSPSSPPSHYSHPHTNSLTAASDSNMSHSCRDNQRSKGKEQQQQLFNSARDDYKLPPQRQPPPLPSLPLTSTSSPARITPRAYIPLLTPSSSHHPLSALPLPPLLASDSTNEPTSCCGSGTTVGTILNCSQEELPLPSSVEDKEKTKKRRTLRVELTVGPLSPRNRIPIILSPRRESKTEDTTILESGVSPLLKTLFDTLKPIIEDHIKMKPVLFEKITEYQTNPNLGSFLDSFSKLCALYEEFFVHWEKSQPHLKDALNPQTKSQKKTEIVILSKQFEMEHTISVDSFFDQVFSHPHVIYTFISNMSVNTAPSESDYEALQQLLQELRKIDNKIVAQKKLEKIRAAAAAAAVAALAAAASAAATGTGGVGASGGGGGGSGGDSSAAFAAAQQRYDVTLSLTERKNTRRGSKGYDNRGKIMSPRDRSEVVV